MRVPHPLVALAVLAASPAWAQTASAEPGYRSAFEGYRAFQDAEVAPWRESNDTVGRIGGWRAYAKEAQGSAAPTPAPAPASAAPPATAPAPVPAKPQGSGHGGHKH